MASDWATGDPDLNGVGPLQDIDVKILETLAGVGPLQRIDTKILPRVICASQELRSPILMPETVL